MENKEGCGRRGEEEEERTKGSTRLVLSRLLNDLLAALFISLSPSSYTYHEDSSPFAVFTIHTLSFAALRHARDVFERARS